MLRFFDPKQFLRVSCILWCFYSKCYSIIKKVFFIKLPSIFVFKQEKKKHYKKFRVQISETAGMLKNNPPHVKGLMSDLNPIFKNVHLKTLVNKLMCGYFLFSPYLKAYYYTFSHRFFVFTFSFLHV